jgi:hypothetical protein
MRVEIDLRMALLRFLDSNGKTRLQELPRAPGPPVPWKETVKGCGAEVGRTPADGEASLGEDCAQRQNTGRKQSRQENEA